MSSKKYRTDFLFPTNGFIQGLGNTFSIAGNYFTFNYSTTDEDADNKAIESDWGLVGLDISQSIESILYTKMETA